MKKRLKPSQSQPGADWEIDPHDSRYERSEKPVYVIDEKDTQLVKVYQVRARDKDCPQEFKKGYITVVYAMYSDECLPIHDFRQNLSHEVIALDAHRIALSRANNMARVKSTKRMRRVECWLESNKQAGFTRIQIHQTGFCLLGIDDVFKKHGWSGNIVTLGEVLQVFRDGDVNIMAACHGLWERYRSPE